MAEKIINDVKSAETSAREIIENRKKQNQSELEAARAAAVNNIQKANSAKVQSLKDAEVRADKDADAEIQALKKEYELKISTLNEIAAKNQPEAVKFIISQI